MPILTQGFGRHIPADMIDRLAVTWGARAIYTGQHIDLLPDRQSWSLADYSEDDEDTTSVCYEERQARIQPLLTWVNNVGLPFLRKEATNLYTDENRTVELNDGKFHIEANPQSSYGYLYIRAWRRCKEPAIHGLQTQNYCILHNCVA
jgi:hypothetical protein